MVAVMCNLNCYRIFREMKVRTHYFLRIPIRKISHRVKSGDLGGHTQKILPQVLPTGFDCTLGSSVAIRPKTVAKIAIP